VGANPNSGDAGSAGRQASPGSICDSADHCTDLEVALAERFREIAYLTLLLRQQEQRDEPRSDEIVWLTELAVALLRMPGWWALLPGPWRGRRIRELLRDKGLFDADDYLERNPDVAATGADPLRHYLQHGMREGRSRSA